MSKSDMVNVKMVITEEKILANIEKVQKMINPNSKKQIVQLEEDTYFKDLIESIKTYLIEYPEKDNFPKDVYDAAYELVEYATAQFEENTKLIEDLIRQREKNIALASDLKDTLQAVEDKESDWKKRVQELSVEDYSEEIIDTLGQMGRSKNNKTPTYLEALKEVNTKIANLESNLHIEIDMERIEDRSKALSYIGIEVAEALKTIPKPADVIEETVAEETPIEEVAVLEEVQEKIETPEVSIEENKEEQELLEYEESVLFEKKPSLWQRIKDSKLGRAVSYVLKIRVRVKIELPNALPEGRGE